MEKNLEYLESTHLSLWTWKESANAISLLTVGQKFTPQKKCPRPFQEAKWASYTAGLNIQKFVLKISLRNLEELFFGPVWTEQKSVVTFVLDEMMTSTALVQPTLAKKLRGLKINIFTAFTRQRHGGSKKRPSSTCAVKVSKANLWTRTLYLYYLISKTQVFVCILKKCS